MDTGGPGLRWHFPPPHTPPGRPRLAGPGSRLDRAQGLPSTCGPSASRTVLEAAAPPRTEKQSYRESYVSDTRDGNRDPEAEAADSGDHAGADRHPPSLRSLLGAGSRCSSHAPVDPQRAGPTEPGELSVDEPEGVAELPTEEPPYSPSTSRSSPGTLGGGRGGRAGDTRGQGRGACRPARPRLDHRCGRSWRPGRA